MNNITFDIDALPQDLRDQLREALATTQDWPQKGDEYSWINAVGEIGIRTFDDYVIHRDHLTKGVIYHPDDAEPAAKVHQAQNRLDIAVMNRGDRNAFVEGEVNWVVRRQSDGTFGFASIGFLLVSEAITVRTKALAEHMIANHAADIVTVITKGRE